MITTAYRHSEDFWAEHQQLILAHILDAELVYLNARNNIGVEQGFFGAAVKDENGTLLAIQTLSYPMIFFADGTGLTKLAAQMARYLTDQRKIPDHLNGDSASTAVMTEAFAACGAVYQAGRRLYQRKCEQLPEAPAPCPPLVNANEVDYDFTEDYQGFLRESHTVYDPAKLKTDIAAMLKSNDLYVLMEQNTVVTMGRLQRKIPGARAVGVIYTPPRYRGRGYSTCCTRQLTRLILDGGYAYAYLYAEADNPVSNHVYEKLGYRKTNDFIEYHLAGQALRPGGRGI